MEKLLNKILLPVLLAMTGVFLLGTQDVSADNSSIVSAIEEDNVGKFTPLAAQPEEIRLQYGEFHLGADKVPSFLKNGSFTVMDAAVLHGSAKCFSYSVNFLDQNATPQTFYCAIASGSQDLMRDTFARLSAEQQRDLNVLKSAIQVAVYCKNTKVLKWLLTLGQDDTRPCLVHEALASAWECANGEVFDFLTDVKNEQGYLTELYKFHEQTRVETPLYHGTPLYVAVREGNLGMVHWLIGHGADVNHQNEDGDTPLIGAIYARNIEMVRLLLNLDADPNFPDRYGKTPLEIVIEEGNIAMIKETIALTEKTIAKTEEATVMAEKAISMMKGQIAMMKGRIAMIEEKTAKTKGTIAKIKEKFAMITGKIAKTEETIALTEEATVMIKELVDHGADLNFVNQYGRTILENMICNQDIEGIKILVKELRLDPNFPNKDSETPLYLALLVGRIEVVQTLVDLGADPDLSNKYSGTPRSLAISVGKSEWLKPIKK